ncbi:putative inner membrane protein [Sodalis glossinidius str. 'morsitans']|uniref:Putative inner membrane protein n=1 Tax=Sodalis glossinidius (strain morsitans) TaxID=343509 RepID=Q2NS57_SODGM|nr:putative transport system permease protein [Sodalis glossinidius str. 'morsitans']CRL45914.1 putative inner membrane protein [Sodalis glossinidius str. 'morsitans']
MLQKLFTGLLCGVLLGFVMQRGRFCLTGGFRDMYLAKNNRLFYALLIAIAIQSLGVYILIAAGQFSYDAGAFPWSGTIVGGYVFGIGIVMAGGCATGTWYRAGEGLIGSWIALAAYMVTSAVMRSPHLAAFNQQMMSYSTAHNAIAETFGLSSWPFIALLVLVALWLARRELKKPKLAGSPLYRPKKPAWPICCLKNAGIRLPPPF